MKLAARTALLFLMMLSAAAAAVAMRPTQKLADLRPKLDLEQLIPHEFEGWHEERRITTQIIDPRQKEQIDKIYNQTLTRTYVNPQGKAVMLSIAYGGDQSDSLQVHLPEGCYAGQGFAVGELKRDKIQIGTQKIPISRMVATLGARVEPVTYWITTAGKVSNNTWDMKFQKLSVSLFGKVPDGMLVRISSISGDTASAYDTQRQFASAMVNSISPEHRERFVGSQP